MTLNEGKDDFVLKGEIQGHIDSALLKSNGNSPWKPWERFLGGHPVKVIGAAASILVYGMWIIHTDLMDRARATHKSEIETLNKAHEKELIFLKSTVLDNTHLASKICDFDKKKIKSKLESCKSELALHKKSTQN